MALAVCALFDAQGERLIRSLWARLEAAGVRTPQTHTHRRHHPHLSYAVLREWDLDGVRAALETLPDGHAFTVNAQGTVAFPRGRAALAVAVTAEAMRRQEVVIATVLATGAQLHKHYRLGTVDPARPGGHACPRATAASGGHRDLRHSSSHADRGPRRTRRQWHGRDLAVAADPLTRAPSEDEDDYECATGHLTARATRRLTATPPYATARGTSNHLGCA